MENSHFEFCNCCIKLCTSQAMYQIQVAGGPAYDAYLGNAHNFYSEYVGLNVGGALLLNRFWEPHVRFGGGILYPGPELIRQYRLFYYPNFRKLVMYRYPLSLGISIYPWLDQVRLRSLVQRLVPKW